MAVVGGIVGGGIFRTPAAVAERVGSSGLILAVWVAGGLVALAGALCFGELGQRRPRAGGGYVYLRETWGPLPAFLYGWALLLVIASGAIAAIAVTFADYTLALTGLPRRLALPLAIGAIVLRVRGQLLRRAARAPWFRMCSPCSSSWRSRRWSGSGSWPACHHPSPHRLPRRAPSERRSFRCSLPMAGGSRPISSPKKW